MVSLVVLFYLEKIPGWGGCPHLYLFSELFSLILKKVQWRLCLRLLKTLTFFNTMLLLLRPYGHS